jgi:hypothetical protein
MSAHAAVRRLNRAEFPFGLPTPPYPGGTWAALGPPIFVAGCRRHDVVETEPGKDHHYLRFLGIPRQESTSIHSTCHEEGEKLPACTPGRNEGPVPLSASGVDGMFTSFGGPPES